MCCPITERYPIHSPGSGKQLMKQKTSGGIGNVQKHRSLLSLFQLHSFFFLFLKKSLSPAFGDKV